MSGGGILFLAHRVPFPPDRGDKIRSHHILRHLARLAPVHVACLADNDADMAQEAALGGVAASHCLVRRAKWLPFAGVESLLRGEPVSISAFRDRRLHHYVRDTIARHRIGAIYVFSGQMGQYVPSDFTGRVIVDLVDVDSAKFEAYAQRGRWPRRWIDAREGRLLRAEEQRLAEKADHTLFISDAEAELFLTRVTERDRLRVGVLANGIDTSRFDPLAVLPEPVLAHGPGPRIVFTGQMDYPPNVAAASRLVRRILPAIRAVYPDARCDIVGRDPASAVSALDGLDGCRVWGAVPDIRPFLAAADLVIVPLDLARGVQNKVLEAMAMARPVVLTPDAATGIGATDGVHFAVASGDGALAERALALLGDRDQATRMGEAARRYVVDHCGWEPALAPLSAMIVPPACNRARHAA